MNTQQTLKIIECPRDAMQGIHHFIPTEVKIEYLNLLLKVGFDTLDFGSFVSPKAIPQMQDTASVLKKLDLSSTKTKLLAIVANLRGATNACEFEEIAQLGYPLSVSESFQQRNTNSGIAASLITVSDIQETCLKHQKELVVYLSMGFGNPYDDVWSLEILEEMVKKMIDIGVKVISIADTTGISTPDSVQKIYKHLNNQFPDIELGLHLHSHPATADKKITAAFEAGCNRFDSAIKGFGGCPMAADELTGNIATEKVLQYIQKQHLKASFDFAKFEEALLLADKVFAVN